MAKFREMIFDTVMADEAGRAMLSEILVPCIKAKHLILQVTTRLAPIIDMKSFEKVENKMK